MFSTTEAINNGFLLPLKASLKGETGLMFSHTWPSTFLCVYFTVAHNSLTAALGCHELFTHAVQRLYILFSRERAANKNAAKIKTAQFDESGFCWFQPPPLEWLIRRESTFPKVPWSHTWRIIYSICGEKIYSHTHTKSQGRTHMCWMCSRRPYFHIPQVKHTTSYTQTVT